MEKEEGKPEGNTSETRCDFDIASDSVRVGLLVARLYRQAHGMFSFPSWIAKTLAELASLGVEVDDGALQAKVWRLSSARYEGAADLESTRAEPKPVSGG